jgi:hypothetical protein
MYSGINLKDYNNYIEGYNLYFKDYARAFFTKFEKITYTIIFTENISRSKWVKLGDNEKFIIWERYYTYIKVIMIDPENRKLFANIKLKIPK